MSQPVNQGHCADGAVGERRGVPADRVVVGGRDGPLRLASLGPWVSTGAGTQAAFQRRAVLPVWSSVDGTRGKARETDCLQTEGGQITGSLNTRFRSSASALKALSSSARRQAGNHLMSDKSESVPCFQDTKWTARWETDRRPGSRCILASNDRDRGEVWSERCWGGIRPGGSKLTEAGAIPNGETIERRAGQGH